MKAAPRVLEIRGLRVERGGVEVLDIPSFHLHDGEFVSLLGPNGSGKTTFLLSMMSLLPRVGGQVLYRGGEILSNGAAIQYRRKIAMILQEPLLFDTSVYENVASGLRIRRLGRREIQRRVLAYLDRFKLGDLAQRSARRISGGEARRVNLARALVVGPEVVFMDEPFANLDLPTRQSITDDLERTIREEGMAAVLVTHDRAEALRFSDRIVVMNGGRIVQSEAPSVVMNNPIDEVVASCVGMETILEGVIRRKTGWEIVVSAAGKEIDALGEGSPGDHVYCCIRPENVIIDVGNPSRTSSVRNLFPARIEGLASVGPYLKVKLDCGFPLVAHVTGESFATLRLEVGKEVFASFKATAIHVIRKGEPGSGRAPA